MTIKFKRGSGSDPGTSDLSVGEVSDKNGYSINYLQKMIMDLQLK